MRRLLGVLREDDQRIVYAPSPGVAQLPLLATVRDAGLQVGSRSKTDGDLPPAVELSAYRIVQEALTNTLKHAGAACVQVQVERDRGRRDGRGG